MIPGETIASGGPDICECGAKLPIKVCQSAAGFYIGTWCDQCGPNSRESGYYESKAEAEKALKAEGYERKEGYLGGPLTVITDVPWKKN